MLARPPTCSLSVRERFPLTGDPPLRCLLQLLDLRQPCCRRSSGYQCLPPPPHRSIRGAFDAPRRAEAAEPKVALAADGLDLTSTSAAACLAAAAGRRADAAGSRKRVRSAMLRGSADAPRPLNRRPGRVAGAARRRDASRPPTGPDDRLIYTIAPPIALPLGNLY